MNTKPWWHTGAAAAASSDKNRSIIDVTVPRAQRAAWAVRREFRLVGHHDCQSIINSAYATSRSDAGGENATFVVRIVREQSRIKATTLSGIPLGFFSEKDSDSYRGVLMVIAERFAEIRCTATVQADWNGELFITLDIASPAQCAAMAGAWMPMVDAPGAAATS
jgi:hypothetical protein